MLRRTHAHTPTQSHLRCFKSKQREKKRVNALWVRVKQHHANEQSNKKKKKTQTRRRTVTMTLYTKVHGSHKSTPNSCVSSQVLLTFSLIFMTRTFEQRLSDASLFTIRGARKSHRAFCILWYVLAKNAKDHRHIVYGWAPRHRGIKQRQQQLTVWFATEKCASTLDMAHRGHPLVEPRFFVSLAAFSLMFLLFVCKMNMFRS